MLAKTLTTPTRTADVSGDLDHPGVSVDPSLEERLRREILQSERTRMLILAGLSASLLVVFPALVPVWRELRRILGRWAAQVRGRACWPVTTRDRRIVGLGKQGRPCRAGCSSGTHL
jgi:hypothetical protein